MRAEREKLQKKRLELQLKLADLDAQLTAGSVATAPLDLQKAVGEKPLRIVIIGASGDLAKKKTYPALFQLHRFKLLPPSAKIYGYARSKLTIEQLQKKVTPHIKEKGSDEELASFWKRCTYFSGQYDSVESMRELDALLTKSEGSSGGNRLFYLAIPPTIFVKAATAISKGATTKSGWNRVVVEKPFGLDSESSEELSSALAKLFAEEQLYRIDHYLGKEMVQNILVNRFANGVFAPVWNRHHIASISISFREDFGTEGRGGYFNRFGIIRDVIQNHLLQILSLIAMEAPLSLGAESIRDEKVKVLRAIAPAKLDDTIVGQYVASLDGSKPGYLDDDGVPPRSTCPTFASVVLWVNNERWSGVPFIMSAGKALSDKKTEVRIQFHSPKNNLFKKEEVTRNELIFRVQPDASIDLRMSNKVPGLGLRLAPTDLDLTFKNRFAERQPEAYERLIFDVMRGDHSQFVRDDELEAAWAIFTPLLHRLEDPRDPVQPIPYPYGTEYLPEALEQMKKHDFLLSGEKKGAEGRRASL